jgi:hypothetical protein
MEQANRRQVEVEKQRAKPPAQPSGDAKDEPATAKPSKRVFGTF